MVSASARGCFFLSAVIRVNGIPVAAYRIWPGQIFKRFSERIGIKIETKKFSSPAKAMQALDQMLEKGQPVGMLTSVFYLNYLPAAYRFHFNAHNIIVFGKENGKYLVSDPVMEYATEISYEDLVRARFAKGMPEPSGRMYYPIKIPSDYSLEKALWKGIRQTSDHMTRIPVPLVGSKGMRYLSKRLRYWRKGRRQKGHSMVGNLIACRRRLALAARAFVLSTRLFLIRQVRSCRTKNCSTCPGGYQEWRSTTRFRILCGKSLQKSKIRHKNFRRTCRYVRGVCSM